MSAAADLPQAADSSPQSGSVEQALRWAQAVATLRGAGQITEAELFIGLLLAHADDRGEVRQFLGHFELTARDVLPDDFPPISVEALRAAAARVGDTQFPWDGAVGEILSIAGALAGGRAQLAHVLGASLQRSTALRQALQLGLDRFGYQIGELEQEYRTRLPEFDLSGVGPPAGTQIGVWLKQRFPLNHASLAPFANDAVDASSDFISVGVEADAFAYLIASKALVPPLAIGLFGNWGSGKSFLMAKIRSRVRQLTELAREAGATETQVWGNVSHVEFNAWQYVETNLWAALLDRIFGALSPQALERLSEKRRGDAQAALDQQQDELDLKEEKVTELSKVAAHHADQAREAEQTMLLKQEQAARNRDALIAVELESGSLQQLIEALSTSSSQIFGEGVTDAVEQTRRLAASTLSSPWRRTAFWTTKRILSVVGAAILVPFVAYGFERWLSSALAGLLAGMAAVAPLLAGLLRTGATFTERQRDQLVTAAQEVDAELAKAVEVEQRKLEEATTRLALARQQVAAAEREAAAARIGVALLTKKREEATAASRLADFVRDRGEAAEYRRLLTEVTMVSRDLRDLTDLTTEYNAAAMHDPAGPPNRIVLYIDDLDRCPPDRVVDVLEAVHLLLSFELFVVVVAVDTRWLTSALHEGLPALAKAATTTGDDPTAIDYLEKIFQIPFWVDPLAEGARQRLLRGLLLPSLRDLKTSATESSGYVLTVGEAEEDAVREMLAKYGTWLDPRARQLSINTDELRFIESLAPLIGDTPRRIKRFVNVCYLLLSMSPPLTADGQVLTERMGTWLLAAIHEGSPLLAEHICRCGGGTNPAAITLRDALTGLTGPIEVQAQRLEDWLRTLNAERASAPPLDSVALRQLTTRWNMIRRLRFEAAANAPGSLVKAGH